jgi:CubicO group peptidase (beta-lactamase class C family)
MIRLGRAGVSFSTAVLVVALCFAMPSIGHSEPAVARCSLSDGPSQPTATPESVGMNAAKLEDAIAFALQRNRSSVQVYRHNCLVGAGPDNAVTGDERWALWSVAKSVVSMVTGIAYDEGLIGLDDSIGKYLPDGVGDDAHRAVTVRQLLTETSGLRSATVSESAPGIAQIEPNIALEALATPLVYPPGSTYEYNQRAVDLLVYVVEQAVGEKFSTFAQRKLFEPIGIAEANYYWARDRSQNTYGFSFLFMAPNDLSKLGLLMLADGSWDGQRVLSASYIRQATTPSERNHCLGLLFWLGGPGCKEPVSGAPPDTFAMAGLGGQNAFVIPSLDIVVTWTGIFGNVTGQGLPGSIQNGAELTHNFFRKLNASIEDASVPDPGPYAEPPVPAEDLGPFTSIEITLGIFGIGPYAYPGCDVFRCGPDPLAPPFSDWLRSLPR